MERHYYFYSVEIFNKDSGNRVGQASAIIDCDPSVNPMAVMADLNKQLLEIIESKGTIDPMIHFTQFHRV
jgi:hypothetical protein